MANITGTNRRDFLFGTEQADTILGLAGDDFIFGRGGNDTIDGGEGNDVVDGGTGNDVVNGGAGIDLLNGGDGIDRVSGGDGADVVSGGAGRDFLTGNAGTDIVDGGTDNDEVSGGDGNDIVRGGSGNDNVDGDDGDDLLLGGSGGDDLVAGDGDDLLFGESGDDDLQGGAGVDHMFGGDGDDDVTGYEGADINHGGAGSDRFGFFLGLVFPSSTFAEHDVVLDFEGAGAAGGDLINLNNEQVAFGGEVDIDPVAGAPLPGAGNGVLDLVYTQRGGDTYLIGDENDDGLLDAADFFVKFEGLHDFVRADFDNTTFLIVGTNGDDSITGTEEDDIIFAAGGDDEVFALGGNDEVHGGTGNDVLDSGAGFDNLFGEEGNDTLSLASSDIGGIASGGDGDDLLFGSDVSASFFDNSLNGDAGDDVIQAGAVGSFMGGGSGSDILISSAEDDQIDGGRDEATFALDGDQDLFTYGGTGRWSTEGSFFGDQISGFEDGSDLIDLRGSGLTFADLVIVNEDFQTTITSDRGTITIFENFDEPVDITAADFLFG